MVSLLDHFTPSRFYKEGWVDVVGKMGVHNPPTLRWEVTKERPGKLSDWEHQSLQDFKVAEQLRVVLRGVPRGDWSDRREGVHAIVEIRANGR